MMMVERPQARRLDHMPPTLRREAVLSSPRIFTTRRDAVMGLTSHAAHEQISAMRRVIIAATAHTPRALEPRGRAIINSLFDCSHAYGATALLHAAMPRLCYRYRAATLA